MIEFELDAEVLGNTVFAFSPLAEVASSLRVLGHPNPQVVHRPWLAQVGSTRSHATRDRRLDLELLFQIVPATSRWSPSFLYPPVSSPRTTVEEQLDLLAELSAHDLEADLTPQWEGAAPPARVAELLEHGGSAGKELAEALHRYWQRAVAPFWLRMTRVLEDDVAHRATQSLQLGLFELLGEIHPSVSLAGHRLRIGMPSHADATYAQARLTLVPSIFTWPGLVLTHERPGEFELTYGARGAGRVWEGPTATGPQTPTLDSLVGRTRASVLRMLATPRSTTELGAELGQSLAAVSRHLTVLRDSGLAASRRTGRVVLYRQTPLGTALVELHRLEELPGDGH